MQRGCIQVFRKLEAGEGVRRCEEEGEVSLRRAEYVKLEGTVGGPLGIVGFCAHRPGNCADRRQQSFIG